MLITKEQSPSKEWGQLACDVSLVLGGGGVQEDIELSSVFERINKLWTDSEKKELTEMFGGKKRKGVTNSGFKFLLTAFETDKNEAGLLLLCRLIDSISWVLSLEGDRRREKAIVKADAVAVLSRVTRRRLISRIDGEKPEMNLEVDRLLFKLLLNIGQKDARFNLKIRMAGVIQVMSRLFLKYDDLLDTFYPLFIRMARSPRSGQMIGRQDGFVNRLTDKISHLNNMESAEHISLLDKHLQILFFILKNRRIRVQLIRDSYCRKLVEILEKHLKACSPKPARRLLSSIFGTTDESTNATTSAHMEAIVTILAILRLLANNKKGKEELIAVGALQICAKKLKSMNDDEAKNGTKAKMVDSMCALALRCMPTVPYPLENIRFPLDYPIPQISTTTSGPSHPGGRVRNSSSINISFDNGRSSDEDDGIDEEDEALNDQNMTGTNQIFERSDDEDGGGVTGKPTVCLPLPKTTKLTTAQLRMYSGFFKEFEEGTLTSGPYLRTEESWKGFCQATQMAMPNRQHLPYDMFVGNNQERKDELGKTTSSMRKMIVEELDKTTERYSNVVYDLDAIIFDGGHPEADQPKNLGKLDGSRDLIFESRFESGNLRRATQVAPTHYELMLSPDMNQLSEHYQWFFFQVSNTRKDIIYTFEIGNCLKPTSMYSQGMQPVMLSLADRGDGWKRAGYNVCYYRNLYACAETTTTTPAGKSNDDNGEEKKKKHYYSMRFNIVFPNTADVVYLAYHFPYTYSFLSASIHEFRRLKLSAVYCREDIIGYSIAGNAMRMLTITAPCSTQELAKKEVIVLSARVHPGESNASWMMHGVLEQLLTGNSAEMYRVREKFVFKVVPMLNPDGVINGSHRCSLAGIDLNRVWDRPNELLHPEIYHTKAIIQYLCECLNKRPVAFVDLHGHSKKWDYFVYGNNPAESWRHEDSTPTSIEDDEHHLALPRALETVTNSKFNAAECRFSITRAKEASARVNIWRQFGVNLAYTLESTYCGFQTSSNKGYQINIGDLKDIGRELLFSFLEISNKEA